MVETFATALKSLESRIGDRSMIKLNCVGLMKAIDESPALPLENLLDFAQEVLQIDGHTFEELKSKCTVKFGTTISKKALVSIDPSMTLLVASEVKLKDMYRVFKLNHTYRCQTKSKFGI